MAEDTFVKNLLLNYDKDIENHNTIQEQFFEFHDLGTYREEKEMKSLKRWTLFLSN